MFKFIFNYVVTLLPTMMFWVIPYGALTLILFPAKPSTMVSDLLRNTFFATGAVINVFVSTKYTRFRKNLFLRKKLSLLDLLELA